MIENYIKMKFQVKYVIVLDYEVFIFEITFIYESFGLFCDFMGSVGLLYIVWRFFVLGLGLVLGGC